MKAMALSGATILGTRGIGSRGTVFFSLVCSVNSIAIEPKINIGEIHLCPVPCVMVLPDVPMVIQASQAEKNRAAKAAKLQVL